MLAFKGVLSTRTSLVDGISASVKDFISSLFRKF
jgi:hypothetical protein